GLPFGVLVAGPAADALITAGAERPPAIAGGRSVAGQQHAAHVAGHPGVVERLVELVDGVRAEGVPDLRAVERDAHGAAARAFLRAAVVGDVGEVEARDGLPHGRVEQLGNTRILHAWDNRSRWRSMRGPPQRLPGAVRRNERWTRPGVSGIRHDRSRGD